MKKIIAMLLVLLCSEAAWPQGFPAPGPGVAASSTFVDAHSVQLKSASSNSIGFNPFGPSTSSSKYTWAFWIKRSTTGAAMTMFSQNSGTSDAFNISFTAADKIEITYDDSSAGRTIDKLTTATYTDTTNWHHILVGFDKTQATADNRTRLYFDGTEVTVWDTDTNIAQNGTFSAFSGFTAIGRKSGTAQFANLFVDENYFIQGQQLTPTSFITGTPGVAKAYTGTYAATDFYFSYEDISSDANMVADQSGNGNNPNFGNTTVASNSSTSHP